MQNYFHNQLAIHLQCFYSLILLNTSMLLDSYTEAQILRYLLKYISITVILHFNTYR